jgi:hypothetical protein
MLISCSHCRGQNVDCPVCHGARVALVSFGQAVFWRRNLSPLALGARKIWRLVRQIMEGVVLVYIILAIASVFYLLLFYQNSQSIINNHLWARLGFTVVVAILYFFYQTRFFRPNKEKVAPHFLPTLLLPTEENEIWQKHSRFQKVNCAPAFDVESMVLIEAAARLAQKKKQCFSPWHLFYVFIYQTEARHYFVRAEIDLASLKKRLVKGLEALPAGFGTAKETLELFLLAYREAIERGGSAVGFGEILIAFYEQKGLAADVLHNLGLTAAAWRNLAHWSMAQKKASLVNKKEKQENLIASVPVGDLNVIFKKIAEQIPFLENKHQVFFSYQALLAAAKIQADIFSEETTLDKIFTVLNSAARAVRRLGGEGKVVLAGDVKKAAKDKGKQ